MRASLTCHAHTRHIGSYDRFTLLQLTQPLTYANSNTWGACKLSTPLSRVKNIHDKIHDKIRKLFRKKIRKYFCEYFCKFVCKLFCENIREIFREIICKQGLQNNLQIFSQNRPRKSCLIGPSFRASIQ